MFSNFIFAPILFNIKNNPMRKGFIFTSSNFILDFSDKSAITTKNAAEEGSFGTEIFKDSNIVLFSTGNIYPFSDINSEGPDENSETGPIGEYAQSALGRERVFQYLCEKNGTKPYYIITFHTPE